MEIRYKEFVNARVLYETVLTTFTANTNIIAFVVVEYAELALKYFRDIDVRKVLRSYFDSFPFSEALLFGLLEFYIKHIEFRETRENEIYEQFLAIVVDGLRRAMQNSPQDYRQIAKIARKYLRDYVPSIYLLKKAEKKIREMEMATRREETLGSKRLLEEEERVGCEERKAFSPTKLGIDC
jgi:lysyl-tRNA synthetase class I